MKARIILAPVQLFGAAQNFDFANRFVQQSGGFTQRFDFERFFRLAQHNRIEHIALLGEAHILRGEGLATAFVESLGRQGFGGIGGGAFAKDFPGAGAENGFFVDVHPGGDALHDREFFFVDGAVAANRNAEQAGCRFW